MQLELPRHRWHDGPHGAALLRAADGRILAGVGLNAGGDWTWWAKADGARRRLALDRLDAMASAERAAVALRGRDA